MKIIILRKPWQSAIGKHAPHHSCKRSDARGHTDLLRGERHPRLKTVALELPVYELAAFVSLLTLDAETTWNLLRLCEYLTRAMSVVLGKQQESLY